MNYIDQKNEKNKGKCIIVGAGEFSQYFFATSENDLIITADGGFDYLKEMGITPDIWLGDMDSTRYRQEEVSEKIEIVKLPTMKDDTDTLSAIRLGIERGYFDFELHGMLGKRLDHTFANVSCLQFLREHQARGILYGRDTFVTLLNNDGIAFSDKLQGMISVFAYGKAAKGIIEKGFLYEVEDAEFQPAFPIGVSNEFVGKKSEIYVENGQLLICGILEEDFRPQQWRKEWQFL